MMDVELINGSEFKLMKDHSDEDTLCYQNKDYAVYVNLLENTFDDSFNYDRIYKFDKEFKEFSIEVRFTPFDEVVLDGLLTEMVEDSQQNK